MSLRVVHVHKIAGVSGSENHLLQLLGGLAAGGRYRPTLLMLAPPGHREASYEQQLRDRGVDVARLPIRFDADPLLWMALVRWLRRCRPAIVHTHLIHADLHGISAARAARVPVVVSSKHNDDPFRLTPVVRAVERALARSTDRVVAISDWLREFHVARVGVPANKIVTVRYGYEPRSATPSVRDGGTATVLAIGRLVPQKGHLHLVRAFAQIASRHAAADLVIVGEGELRESLEREVARLGLGGRVRLPGYVPDAATLLSRATVLAHPSLWEGFGLVLLEAMAAGVPVIASSVSAIPEVIGDAGLLVAPGDEGGLAAALDRIFSDEALRVSLAAAGRQRAGERFSVRRMVEETAALYDDLLRAKGIEPEPDAASAARSVT